MYSRSLDRLADLAADHPDHWRDVLANDQRVLVTFQGARIGLEGRPGYTVKFNSAFVLAMISLPDRRVSVVASTLPFFQQNQVTYPNIKAARHRLKRELLLLGLIYNMIDRRDLIGGNPLSFIPDNR